ncbi:MAG: bifunctional phosphopantothenoylcysteine decarboxylase/phosphopantothenate--cysteine ligase CoaBC [Gammaproteobacteria bacterium]
MHSLTARRLLLVVSGGIAAYKAPDVVRRLREAGAEVRVVMTPGATRFVTPLTLQAVCGHPVRVDLFDSAAEAAMGHIELARWCEAVVVAPATADFLARLRAGLADDLATAVCLATTAPLLIAPAMNQQMWQHPATADNLATLAARGVRQCGPASGSQACGETGPGRMVESADIVAATAALFTSGLLAACHVMVTAGPTREALDPVRYISNHSSGKMGYAVAAAARDAGATVTLVSGPTRLAVPAGVRHVAVESAADMLAAVQAGLAACDIFIATAAVADYRPATPSDAKLKRDGAPRTLELVPNPDILASVAARDDAPFTVGFAAETHDVETYARAKLVRKGIDMIAANQVGGGLGFDSDDNELVVLWADGRVPLARAAKPLLARQLVELIATRYRAACDGGHGA